MDSTQKHTSKRKVLFDKSNWSKNSFSWFYAVLIMLLVLIFAIVLKLAGIYESMAMRIVNVFFILIGFIVLIWDYEQSKNVKLKFQIAFVFCIRTGFYFALLFLPILLIFLIGDKGEIGIILTQETMTTNYPIQEILVSNYMETAASVAIMGYVAAITAGFVKPKKQRVQ